MNAALTAFLLVGVAELGDKSRLVGLLLAATFRAPWPVFWGMTAGFLLLHAPSVWLGARLGALASPAWVGRASGALFVVLGAAALTLSEKGEAAARDWLERRRHWGPFWLSAAAVAGSELLDRTQLACAALSARTGRPWAVLAGTTAALALLDAATVWLGAALAARVPMGAVYKISGALFLAAGAALLLKA